MNKGYLNLDYLLNYITTEQAIHADDSVFTGNVQKAHTLYYQEAKLVDAISPNLGLNLKIYYLVPKDLTEDELNTSFNWEDAVQSIKIIQDGIENEELWSKEDAII